MAQNGMMTAEIAGHEIEFPIKFKVGHRLSENEAGHLNNLYLSRFGSNIRSDVERREKKYSADDLLAKWTDYSLGAPREGTGTSVREEAALQFAQEQAVAQNKSLPRAKRGSTDDEKAAVQAARDAIVARILASTKESTVARVAEIVAEIKAKRAAAAANSRPAVEVESFLADV